MKLMQLFEVLTSCDLLSLQINFILALYNFILFIDYLQDP